MLGRWHQPGPYGYELRLRINRRVGEVGEYDVRRIYRNRIGDWCAELAVAGKIWVEVFDNHPTLAMMRGLNASGTDIADDVVSQGAEGEDIRGRSDGL